MKEIETPFAKMTVSEREDYSLALTRRGDGGEHKEIHLYKVRLETTVHVLAESEEGAIDQAHCAVKDEREAGTTAEVERVSFVIRGWSGNRF